MIFKQVFIKHSLNYLLFVLQFIILTSCEAKLSWEERALNSKCEDKDDMTSYNYWYEKGSYLGKIHGGVVKYDEVLKSTMVPSCEDAKLDAIHDDSGFFGFPEMEKYQDCWCKGYLDAYNNAIN
jgi:hypothetical protein